MRQLLIRMLAPSCNLELLVSNTCWDRIIFVCVHLPICGRVIVTFILKLLACLIGPRVTIWQRPIVEPEGDCPNCPASFQNDARRHEVNGLLAFTSLKRRQPKHDRHFWTKVRNAGTAQNYALVPVTVLLLVPSYVCESLLLFPLETSDAGTEAGHLLQSSPGMHHAPADSENTFVRALQSQREVSAIIDTLWTPGKAKHGASAAESFLPWPPCICKLGSFGDNMIREVTTASSLHPGSCIQCILFL